MTAFYNSNIDLVKATKTTTRPSLEAGPNVHLYLGKYSEGRAKPQVWDLYRNPRTNEVFAIHEKD